MFKRLAVQNFRKLRDATFDFEGGVVCVRGANEAGKSTLVEALAYALFGVRACREGLEGLVTWGQSPSSLNVELEIVIDGVSYKVRRNKAGAEIRFTGREAPDVVGQTEVGEFLSRLLGMDSGSMSRLVLASQGSIRGALDEGPAKTVEMIETLAGLGQVDELVSLVAARLPNGSLQASEAVIKQIEESLTNLEAQTLPDLAALEENAACEAQVVEAASVTVQDAEAAYEAIRAEHISVLHEVEKHRTRQAAREQTEKQLREAEKHRDEVSQVAAQPEPDLATLQKNLDTAKTLEKAATAYQAVSRYLTLPDVHWVGSEASLRSELDLGRVEAAAMSNRIAESRRNAEVAAAQIVSSSTCGFCKADVSQFPEIETRNRELREVIAAAELEVQQASDALNSLRGQNAEYERLLNVQSQLHKDCTRALMEDWVCVEDETVPSRVTWIGPNTQQEKDLVGAQQALERARIKAAAIAAALAKLPLLEASVLQLEQALNTLGEANHDLDSAVIKARELELARLSKEASLKDAKAALVAATQAATEAAGAYKEAVTAHRYAQNMKQSLLEQLATAKQNVSEIADNNELIKALRGLRPVVVDAVWGMVLSAVSQFFTHLRGEPSVVEKSGKEFTVNGRSVAGLSGSTKDVLGLAIRIALTATFLPHVRFLVLDEPWAACDSTRSERGLGFLKSTGFEQVLLITHDEASEAVADSLIYI